MGRSMMRLYVGAVAVLLALLWLVPAPVYATGAFSFTLPGGVADGTYSVLARNGADEFYEYSATTNGINGVRHAINSATASWPFGVPPGGDPLEPDVDGDITDYEWGQIGQDKAILLQGSIPADGLAGMNDFLSNLQIGFVTREHAAYVADTTSPDDLEMAAMFNDSAYLDIYKNGTTGYIHACDYYGEDSSTITFDIDEVLYYEMVLEHASSMVYFRAASDISSWQPWYAVDGAGVPLYCSWNLESWGGEVGFGIGEVFGSPGDPEDFSESALLVQLHNASSTLGSTVIIGDITVTAIPEPVSLIFFGTGMIGLLGYANRKRMARS